MKRKTAAIVMCAAALLVGVLTIQGKHMERLSVPRTLTAEQAARECAGLLISPAEQAIIEQIWAGQAGYDYNRRELDDATCDTLGVPGGEAYAQVAPGPDGPASDILYIDCRSAAGGRVTYEVTMGGHYNKSVRPAGRDALYVNSDNTAYQKYTKQVWWPWSNF